ncbi:MAG: sugar kinase [Henriciella sp.]|uniref:sugar kinase n=1 Tax=Henriciella sp. TaxID=1968823 RepID=UPI003C719F1C
MGLVDISGPVVAIGEVMLELSGPEPDNKRLAWAGDTANTLVYLSRLGAQTSYLTALGRDPYSEMIEKGLDGEGIDTGFVLRHPSRLPGLYTITTAASGERSFHYWRGQSAARAFFELEESAGALLHAASAGVLYLTGVTLSIFTSAERAQLIDRARRVRANGGHVAFDPNYRETGWESANIARQAVEAIAPHVSLALPTRDDEDKLFGTLAEAEHIQRWLDAGADEVALKCGADGAVVASRESEPATIPAESPAAVVDTTGAGDSFNAAYLAARLGGASPSDAAAAGNRLAALVIGYRGSIIPAECMAQSDMGLSKSL